MKVSLFVGVVPRAVEMRQLLRKERKDGYFYFTFSFPFHF